jgi:formate dehydrogenase maturation protein FdhE
MFYEDTQEIKKLKEAMKQQCPKCNSIPFLRYIKMPDDDNFNWYIGCNGCKNIVAKSNVIELACDNWNAICKGNES